MSICIGNTSSEATEARYFAEDLGNSINLEMIAIPGGKFLMGTEDQERERLIKEFDGELLRKEKPQHEVTVQPFFMGKYPITQAQWKAVCEADLSEIASLRDLECHPCRFKGDDHPVEQVSWYDAVRFCQRLSKQTVREYRLPSEAEWEYACRAGTTTAFHFGETITDKLANYSRNVNKTTAVGQFSPNAFGLYDMHGNVWEWCQDNWHGNYEDAPEDGSAWLSGTSNTKVRRGGSWFSYPDDCRSAYRDGNSSDNRINLIGFRVVCVASRDTQ